MEAKNRARENDAESIKVVERFFDAVESLIACGRMKNYQEFIDRYGIIKSKFYDARRNKERKLLQISWLAYLINDYGVSAEWLMTGKGKMFHQ